MSLIVEVSEVFLFLGMSLGYVMLVVWDVRCSSNESRYNRLKSRWPYPKRSPKTIVLKPPKAVCDTPDSVWDYTYCDLWNRVHSRHMCSVSHESCEGGP